MGDQHGEEDTEQLLASEEGADATRGALDAGPQSAQVGPSVFARIRRSWIAKETLLLFKLAFPITLTLILEQLLFFISMLFIGHITGRSLELDAAGLGFTIMNMSGVSIGVGLSTGAETLFTQTFGYKNYKRVGTVLQRGILILGVVLLPLSAIWLNSLSVVLLLQQSPCVARLAAQYIKIFCLALPAILLYHLLQMYFQAQGIVWAIVFVGVLSNIISAVMHWILIYPAKLGLIGATTALVIAYNSSPLILMAYAYTRGLHRRTWGGWSWDSLREWSQFLRLGVPGLLMTCIEWWSFEVATFVTGSIDDTQLAIYSIVMTIFSVFYQGPLGLAIACTVRVGNELGAGNPLAAKRATYLATSITFTIGLGVAVLLGSLKDSLGTIFTHDEQVISGVAKAMYVACPLMVFDQIQVTIGGVLRGSGRQALGAVVNFVTYYIIGLPLGISLALVAHMGTLGMLIGLTVADILQTSVFLIAIVTTNWEKQSKLAIKRAQGLTPNSGQPSTCDSTLEVELASMSVSQEDTAEAADKVLSSPSPPEAVECEPLVCGNAEDSSFPKTAAEEDPLECEAQTNDSRSLRTAAEVHPLMCSEEDNYRKAPVLPAGTKKSTRLRLLISKGSLFVAGAVFLVAAGIASQYHPPTDFSVCHNSTTDRVNQTYTES